jgi:hypothetical protein
MVARLWVALLSGLVLACGSPSDRAAPRDVLLVVVDGLRADAAAGWIEEAGLGDWFGADDTVRFTRAYAPSSLGAQSLAALFSGRLPTHGGGVGLAEAQPAERAHTLATALRRAGYRTGFVSQAGWAARPGFARGFDDLQVAPAAGWAAAEVTARSLQVIDDWRALARAEGGAETPARPSFLIVHWTAAPPTEGADLDPDLDQATGEAERALAEAGSALAALRQGLEHRRAFAGGVVALTSGHGFERGEHGGTGAGWTLHEEVIRVPLVVRGLARRGSGDRGSGTVDAPVSALALGVSLRDLAGGARDPEGSGELADAGDRARAPGDDGAEAGGLPLPGAPDGAASAAPVIAELVVRERAIARAVIDGDVKLLQVLREVPPTDRAVVARGYEELQAAMAAGAIPLPPLFDDPVRELLLRVEAAGVGETELALAEHREVLSRLRAVLRDYRRLCEEDGWAPPEITERLPVDLEDVEQLEMLGYL